MQNENMDRHFAGKFNIGGEEITGELIYNKENGVTMLNLVKQLTDAPLGRSYPNLDVITGVLNTGTAVTLFHNHCTKNYTQAFQTQQHSYFHSCHFYAQCVARTCQPSLLYVFRYGRH